MLVGWYLTDDPEADRADDLEVALVVVVLHVPLDHVGRVERLNFVGADLPKDARRMQLMRCVRPASPMPRLNDVAGS